LLFGLKFKLERVEPMPLKMRVHDREPIALALRRFKKLLERSGIQKELRKRKYYEKPCEARRRAELRRLSSIRKARQGTAGKK
jgi:small subunit ribosomal protein S21